MRRPRAQSRILKKFPCPPGRNCAGEGHRSKQDRNLVRRRGAHWSEEQNYTPVGQARHAAERTARSAHRFNLHLRRHLSSARQGRSSGSACLQYRGDDPASGRDRHDRRDRSPCGAPGRSSRLAHVRSPRYPLEHHHSRSAAEIARAQFDGEYLAIHARQLALKPHLRILRRHR